jgi:hypothetical protein
MKFELFYPLTPVGVNQPFGVNGEYYRRNGINILGHNGIDFFAYHGQPLYAPMDGTAYYEVDSSGGQGVVIVSDKVYDYKNSTAVFKCIMWHMCDPNKEPKYASPIFAAVGSAVNSGKGTIVKSGDLVGFADSTGLSSGDHLHFGLKPITTGTAPLSGDAPDVGIGDWVNIEQNNGYLGAIDPQPYFNGQFRSTTPNPPHFTYVFNTNLKYGLGATTEVHKMQEALQYLGYMKQGVFGPFGPATKLALGLFQTASGIKDPEGQGTNFGPATRKAMNAKLSV